MSSGTAQGVPASQRRGQTCRASRALLYLQHGSEYVHKGPIKIGERLHCIIKILVTEREIQV